jgi:hypothetical protein
MTDLALTRGHGSDGELKRLIAPTRVDIITI